MTDTPEHVYGHMLHERYVAKVRRLSDARRRRIERITTRAEAEAYAKRVRRRIRRSFGPEPARTALNTQVTGRIKATGYAIETLRFESRPGFFVTANLYVPLGRGPFPVVLGACGHSQAGKAEPAYQKLPPASPGAGSWC